jgi:serine/threonine-protein kinase
MLGAAGENGRQQFLARFEREAKATAALTSPHTVQIYDYGVTDEGVFYYVMELLHGLDLRTLVERFGPLPPGRVVHLLEQVCASLEEAHDGGLIHRDVKPANVFTCRVGFEHDFVKVLDFGLVLSRRERSGEDLRLTLPHTAAGTPAFMAPEMILEDREIDGRADLYGVGCLAYWLLTGGHVFDEDSSMKMAVAHVQTPPVPPSERSELPVPPALESLVLACLEKDPERRPPHAGALRRRLAEMDGKDWGSDEAARWWQLHLPGEARQPGTPSLG